MKIIFVYLKERDSLESKHGQSFLLSAWNGILEDYFQESANKNLLSTQNFTSLLYLYMDNKD